MIVKKYNYESILAELPNSIMETYSLSHNEDINALMVSYYAPKSMCVSNTIPIDDIYEILVTETSVNLRGTKCNMTIFINIKLILFQVL